MIYLLLKIVAYLLLALLAGGAAGWLLRNLAAAKQEEEAQRALGDARGRIPQFESQVRARDEQLKRVKEDLSDKDDRINELSEELRKKDAALREKERELKTHTARNELIDGEEQPDALHESGMMGGPVLEIGPEQSAPAALPADESPPPGVEAARLKAEIARLEQELAAARATVADAVAEAAAAEAEVVTLKATLARAAEETSSGSPAEPAADSSALKELETRLQQKAGEYDRLNKAYETEQRKVVELERERELQNKSLQVLHQQLELERERVQTATGG